MRQCELRKRFKQRSHKETARSAVAAIMTFETKKIIDFCVPIFCHQFYHLDNDVVATVVELENVNSYFENFQQVGKYGVLLVLK